MYTAVTSPYNYNLHEGKIFCMQLVRNPYFQWCVVLVVVYQKRSLPVDLTLLRSSSMEMPSSMRVVRIPAVIRSGEEPASVVGPSGVATSYRLRTRREHKVDVTLIMRNAGLVF